MVQKQAVRNLAGTKTSGQRPSSANTRDRAADSAASKWSAPAGGFPAGAVVCGPGGEELPAGSWYSARGACKPNSVVCGHSSRRRVAADAHQRPTRRFRHVHRAAWARRAGAQRRLALADISLPIWSCSVWGLPCPRRYRRGGALLPHHFTLTPALEFPQRRAYPASRANSGIAFPGRPSRKRGSRGGIFSVALAVHGF